MTAWSDLTVSARPQVQSIRAQTRQPQQTWNESTWIPIEHRRLEVIEGSQVALHLQADQSLSQVQVHQDGKLIETLTPEGCQASYECLPETSQALTFTPINEMGQAVEEPLYLKLEVKTDQKPYFELREPEKDLPLATPAAVTVTFLVCDDIGLDRVALCYEVKDSPMVCLEEPITPPVKEVTLTRTLPLDQWNLEEGDTVMFYATARDTPLDPNTVRPEAYSEIYLIEIQREVQIKPSSKSTTPNAVETLMDALAYLRAIIKKTWNLSHTTPWTPLQEELLHLLTLDLTHTMEIIASHRDDEQKNYGPQDTAILYQVNATLTEALDALKTLRLTEAMESEKHGYRLLRDLLQEQDRTPDRSPSSPPSITPEKLEIPFEPNQPSAMSEQQAQQQLNKIQKQLESLIQQQRQVNSASNQTSPSSTNDSPSVSPHEASQRMRHDMMMAQQQALRSQADQIQTALDQVSQRSSGQEQQSSQQASQHMQQAVEAMNAIQPERDDVHVTLNEVQEQLMQAEAALDQSLRDKQTDPQIKQAQRLIEQLMQDVQALNQNPQPTHTKNIQKHLQQAGQLLRSMESSQTSAGQSVPLNWGHAHHLGPARLLAAPLPRPHARNDPTAVDRHHERQPKPGTSREDAQFCWAILGVRERLLRTHISILSGRNQTMMMSDFPGFEWAVITVLVAWCGLFYGFLRMVFGQTSTDPDYPFGGSHPGPGGFGNLNHPMESLLTNNHSPNHPQPRVGGHGHQSKHVHRGHTPGNSIECRDNIL